MMRAAVLHDWNDIRIEQRPVPAPGPGEVLIKIESCSICGGDVKIVTRGMIKQPPMGTFIIGHEYAGTIVELGEAVDEFVLGDRVTVEVHKGCGRCRNCIDGKYTACLNYGNLAKGHRANGFTTNGGFAEYAVNHVNTISKIPDNISFDEATIITTAGTALFGIEHTGGFVAGDSVAVVGPGAIGLMAVQCAKALGAGKVILTGTRDERLNLGKKLGADVVINLNKEDPLAGVKRETGGYGADLVLLTAGNSASLPQAHFEDTVSADLGICVQNSNNLYPVRGEGKRCVHRALELMRMGKIQAKDLLPHSYPLDQIQEAFRVFMAREGGAIRIVLHP
jgi:L-iditol 2-dehydrogenase